MSHAPRHLTLPAELSVLAPYRHPNLVRVGKADDGGYLIPSELIEQTDVLLSLGLNDDWSFDADFLARKPNLLIHAYDHTISAGVFFKELVYGAVKACCGRVPVSTLAARYRVWRSYKTFFRGRVTHFRERIHNRHDRPGDATLADLMARVPPEKNIFIKMDIEGAEYRVLRDALSYRGRIIGMALEAHDTEPYRRVFLELMEEITEHYTLVHTHANNFGPVASDDVPEVFELTLIRGDLFQGTSRHARLPLPEHDHANTDTRPDYILSFQSVTQPSDRESPTQRA